ncbi:hypothetical protein WT19_14630 [Burkholderia stagnalis]|nr:hypothetical protein WT19_14630 [Burkholderia stagnalis]KVW53844.1 hypothetical protein WT28_32780 [Burkholderia stagnalis]KVX70695.1 hypothetical protein WT34_21520 [Burkholderia stagnalis]KWH92253.1 hypothetical protein WT68_15185 [Burkholderia stagnalis]KWI01706.1 hypothetical protein WT69_03535 [Burkholderia stagnalis]
MPPGLLKRTYSGVHCRQPPATVRRAGLDSDHIDARLTAWFARSNTIGVSAGSYGALRQTLDSTGPVTKSLAYRFVAMNENNGSFRDTVSSKRYLFAPSFTWDIGADTTLHYEFESVRQRAPLDRGVVAVNGQLGAIPASRFLGEPRDGDYDVRNTGHQFTLEHRVDANWSINAGFAQRTTDLSHTGRAAQPVRVARLRVLVRSGLPTAVPSAAHHPSASKVLFIGHHGLSAGVHADTWHDPLPLAGRASFIDGL